MATILIIGGNSGIGLECSKRLASDAKNTIVLAGRDMNRVEAAARELQTKSARIKTLQLDVSSLASVRTAAGRLGVMLDRGEIAGLNAILCNAGAQFNGPVPYSPDGYEMTFATNYLGYFLLVELLLDRLDDHGRIVFTASGTHDPATADGKMVGIATEPDAFALANVGKDGEKPISVGVRYTTSKLCDILFAYQLDRRLRGVNSKIGSIAFDPGSVSGTGLLRTHPKPVQFLARTALMKWVMDRMNITQSTVQHAGAALADLAVSPAYANASGKYFQAKKDTFKERRSSKKSYDEAAAKKLWADSERLVHLAPEEQSKLLCEGQRARPAA